MAGKRGATLPAPEQAALPPKPQDCPDCRTPLRSADSFCEACRAYWGFQVLHRATNTWDRKWGTEPHRGCPACGGEVGVLDGYCAICDEYRAPRLVYEAWRNRAATWILLRWKELAFDPALDRRCTKEENLAGMAACRAAVFGKPGPMAREIDQVVARLTVSTEKPVEEVPF